MLTTIAIGVAATYLTIGLVSVIALMGMSKYKAARMIGSSRGIDFLSLCYYFSVAVLVLQHQGLAAWILTGAVVIPFLLGLVGRDEPIDPYSIKSVLAWGVMQLAIQAGCIFVIAS